MKKFSQGIVLLIPLIFLTSVAVIIIGYFAITNSQQKQQGSQFSPASTANLSRDEVLRDWKTYTNREYGFSFDYPQEANLTKNGKNNLLVSMEYQDPSTVGKGAIGVWGWLVRMYGMENAKNLSINDFFEEQKISDDPYINNESIETKQFAGKPAIYWETNMGGIVNNMYIETGNGIMLIQYNVYSAKPEHQDTVYQILSTFQFTD